MTDIGKIVNSTSGNIPEAAQKTTTKIADAPANDNRRVTDDVIKKNSVTQRSLFFGSQEVDRNNSVFRQAKNKVLAALNCEYPREHSVFIEDNKIIHEIKGSEYEIKLTDYIREQIYSKGRKITSVHGHPSYGNESGASLPVSLSDFYSFYKADGQNEIIALNPKGEYSLLRKGENYKPIDSETHWSLRREYGDLLVKCLSEEEREEYENLRNLDHPIDMEKYQYLEDELLENPNVNPYDIRVLVRNLRAQELINKTCELDSAIKAVHNFWLKHAEALGLEYETNYSYLDHEGKSDKRWE